MEQVSFRSIPDSHSMGVMGAGLGVGHPCGSVRAEVAIAEVRGILEIPCVA